MGFIIGLIIAVAIAFACSKIAGEKNRSEGGWFVLGFIFGFWALLVIALLGDPYESKSSTTSSKEYNRYQYEDYD